MRHGSDWRNYASSVGWDGRRAGVCLALLLMGMLLIYSAILSTSPLNAQVRGGSSAGESSGNVIDDNVSGDDNEATTVINVPNKPLPKTGGAAPVSMLGVLVYGSAFLVIPMLCIALVFLAQRFQDRRGS